MDVGVCIAGVVKRQGGDSCRMKRGHISLAQFFNA